MNRDADVGAKGLQQALIFSRERLFVHLVDDLDHTAVKGNAFKHDKRKMFRNMYFQVRT